LLINLLFWLFSGRPIRPKETGLTEEELTEEIVTSSGQKIFKCKKCEKEFSFSSRLKRHLLVHTGARPFECPICLRRFTQAVDLKRHMLRHSGQKPHVCQYCGKQYTRGDRLKVNNNTMIQFVELLECRLICTFLLRFYCKTNLVDCERC